MLRIYRLKRPIFALALVLGAVAFLNSLPALEEQQPTRPPVNVQVSQEQFAGYIDEWSEPDEFFDTDNFISNETSYLHVVGALRNQVQPGGVYLGVGPDQNF